MPVPAACPKCRAAYTMPDDRLGKQVRCGQCQTVFTVQPVGQARPPIQAACSNCQTAYTLPGEQLGQKVRCRQCQAVFLVQQAPTTPPPIPVATTPKPPFPTACPTCQQSCAVPAAQLGKTVRCPACQATFVARPAVQPHRPEFAPREGVETRVKPVSHDAAPPVRQGPETRTAEPLHPRESASKISPAAPRSSSKWLVGGVVAALALVALGVGGVIWLSQSEEGTPAGTKSSPHHDTGKLARADTKADPEAGKKARTLARAQKNNLTVHVAKKAHRDGKAQPLVEKKDLAKKAPSVVKEDPARKVRPLPAREDPDKKEAPVVVVNGELPAAVLAKVKQATAYLRVTLPSGSVVQGSGFLGLEAGIVLTNAHVLGMLEPDSRQPQRIDVVLNSGTSREKAYRAQVLGVDRATDLAVLRIPGGAELPAPLQIKSARTLKETQTVFVFGFPLGDRLGKNISVRKSSVSSLRTDQFGSLKQVQVEGGMNPGNSGGPVVNSQGEVIGVAVSGIVATQLNFAVPGDAVQVIVNGRLTTITTHQPYKAGQDVKVPLTLALLDPLKRVGKVSVEYWIGKAGKPRPASLEQPKPLAGDCPSQTQQLTYQNGRAAGEFTLAPLTSGQVYWLRPVYVDGAGDTKWAGAISYSPPPLIEHKPALLALKHSRGLRPLVLTSSQALRLVDSDGDAHEMRFNMENTFLENTGSVDAEGNATIALNYKRLRTGLLIDKQLVRSPRFQLLNQHSLGVQTILLVDRRGKILKKSLNVQRVPPSLQKAVTERHEQVETALKTIAIPLPAKQIEAGARWTDRQPLVMFTENSGEEAVMDLTYIYLGTRVRNGREEAFIEITGHVIGPRGRERRIGGRAQGMGLLDLATGQISFAKITVALDLDMRFGKRSAKANGTLEVTLRRDVVAVVPQPEAVNQPAANQKP